TDLERRAIYATQTASGDFTQCDTIDVTGQQRSIDTDLPELVDQHRPTLVRRSLGQQVLDQAGLAGAQWPGDDVRGNVLQHGRGFLRRWRMRLIGWTLLLSLIGGEALAQACVVHSTAERLDVKVCQENRSIPEKLFADGFCQPNLAGQKVEVQYVD